MNKFCSFVSEIDVEKSMLNKLPRDKVKAFLQKSTPRSIMASSLEKKDFKWHPRTDRQGPQKADFLPYINERDSIGRLVMTEGDGNLVHKRDIIRIKISDVGRPKGGEKLIKKNNFYFFGKGDYNYMINEQNKNRRIKRNNNPNSELPELNLKSLIKGESQNEANTNTMANSTRETTMETSRVNFSKKPVPSHNQALENNISLEQGTENTFLIIDEDQLGKKKMVLNENALESNAYYKNKELPGRYRKRMKIYDGRKQREISKHPPPVGFYDLSQHDISNSTKNFKISNYNLDRSVIPRHSSGTDWLPIETKADGNVYSDRAFEKDYAQMMNEIKKKVELESKGKPVSNELSFKVKDEIFLKRFHQEMKRSFRFIRETLNRIRFNTRM